MKVEDGVGRATEEEETIDVEAARRCIDDPNQILLLDSPIVQNKKK